MAALCPPWYRWVIPRKALPRPRNLVLRSWSPIKKTEILLGKSRKAPQPQPLPREASSPLLRAGLAGGVGRPLHCRGMATTNFTLLYDSLVDDALRPQDLLGQLRQGLLPPTDRASTPARCAPSQTSERPPAPHKIAHLVLRAAFKNLSTTHQPLSAALCAEQGSWSGGSPR